MAISTVADLYDAIDWSHVDKAGRETDKKMGALIDESDEWRYRDAIYRYRCVLLDEALHANDRAMMMEARRLLKPVWHQVIRIVRTLDNE